MLMMIEVFMMIVSLLVQERLLGHDNNNKQ
jgi:hypothetical protein